MAFILRGCLKIKHETASYYCAYTWDLSKIIFEGTGPGMQLSVISGELDIR